MVLLIAVGMQNGNGTRCEGMLGRPLHGLKWLTRNSYFSELSETGKERTVVFFNLVLCPFVCFVLFCFATGFQSFKG